MAFPKSQSIIIVCGIGMTMQNHAKKRFNNRSSTNAMAAIAIGAMLVFSVAGVKAFADTIENSIEADVPKSTTIDEGASITVTYWVKVQAGINDAQNGCNAQDTTALNFDVNFPNGVTAKIGDSVKTSPITLKFTKCGELNGQDITFSSDTAGSYQIVTNHIVDNGVGLYTDNSDFTLNVQAASGGGGGGGTDTTPPELQLPSNIEKEATDASGAVVDYTATATDNVDENVQVDCKPPSGSTFPIGSTTVNCSATDAAGNEATGSFTVTITAARDRTAPELLLPDNIVA